MSKNNQPILEHFRNYIAQTLSTRRKWMNWKAPLTFSIKLQIPRHIPITTSLKKGYVIILLWNLQPWNGYVNGSCYTVDFKTNNFLLLRVASESNNGKRLILLRMLCKLGNDNFPIPGFKRTQFTVRNCFSIMNNNAQGQSFDGAIGNDLNHEFFTRGLLYVTMSKITNRRKISVYLQYATTTPQRTGFTRKSY